MRIAFDARHAARGLGISTFIANLAAELVVADPSCELVWLGDPARAPAGIASAVRADRPPYPMLDGPLGRAFVRRLGVDVMHFTGNTGWGRRGPVPTVLTLHDLIFMSRERAGTSPRQRLGHPYERWLIGRALAVADAVVLPSRTVADDVARVFGEELDVHVILEGVDPPDAHAAAAQPAGMPPYIVAFAGRDPRKRTEDVVAGWRALAPAQIRLRLLASGGLPAGLRDALASEIVAGSVEIFEHLPREQLWELLAGATALVYPSVDEGFGLPVLEGMAAGTPVLAGLAAVTREVGGEAIVPLDPTDIPGSIAAGVRRLLDDPRERARVIESGRQRASAFTWQRTASAYLELYHAVAVR